MNRIRPSHLLASALLAAAVAPSAAQAAPSQVLYDVTFKATMTESWRFHEHYTDDCNLTGAMCVRDEDGAGSAKIQLRSRRPTRFRVLRAGPGGRPTIGAGTGEGIPLVGSSLREGTHETQYSGPWDAGNPDKVESTDDCGDRTVRGDVVIGWEGLGRVAPRTTLSDDRDDCPDGGGADFEFPEGDSPSLDSVLADVAPRKFLGTKQFTVRGSRSWTGTVEPINRSSRQGEYVRDGSKTVAWSWEATFRRAGTKRRR